MMANSAPQVQVSELATEELERQLAELKEHQKVLETELKASILQMASPPGNGGVTNKPASMVDNLGNKRVGEAVGLNEIQFGPVVLPGNATLFAPEVVELSFCSQQ